MAINVDIKIKISKILKIINSYSFFFNKCVTWRKEYVTSF